MFASYFLHAGKLTLAGGTLFLQKMSASGAPTHKLTGLGDGNTLFGSAMSL